MNIRRITASVTLAGAVAAGIAPAAMALSVQFPSVGGTWEYGFEDAYARSYYSNGSRCHGSTASNDWGTVRSIDTAAGKKSIAEKFGTIFTHNKYYYRTC